MCLECIALKALVTPERAESTLEMIAGALVLTRETARCVACGETTTTYAVGRPV